MSQGRAAYALTRARRRLDWAHDGGLLRLARELDDPRRSPRGALARRAWRRSHPTAPGSARVAFIAGAQRSGTTMLLRALAASPQIDPYAEGDPRLFTRYRLSSPEAVVRTVRASRQEVVLLKPLCDSHDLPAMLSLFAGESPRGLWLWRDVDARARSAVRKFGPTNQRVLARLAAEGVDGSWLAGGVTPEILAAIRAADPARLDPHSGAALFWWLRTGLYFSRGLDARPEEVRLVSYADVLDDPPAALTVICGHLGIEPVPAMWSDVSAQLTAAAKSGMGSELPLAPKVRDLCDELTARLRAATPAPR